MDVFKKITTVRYSFIIFSFLIGTILVLLLLFIFDVLQGPKWAVIIPGLLTGFVIALFQALLSWYELRKIDEYDSLKKKILSHRKDADYYGSLIEKSKNEIKLLGVTAQRFLDDFGSDNPKAPLNEKVLLRAMDEGVRVKILVASHEFLDDGENKQKADQAQKRLLTLYEKYPNYFEYCYYKHKPAHSIVIIDEECIVGPIFPKVESRYTPAIHLKTSSNFAVPYIDYFDQEWKHCRQNQQ